MLRNYLIQAFRILAREKGLSFINIVGLAIGIASSLAILLWVLDEISYDRFHVHADSIYRCYREIQYGSNTRRITSMSAPAGPALLERTPEITEYVRSTHADVTLRNGAEVYVGRGLYVDPSFLTLFSFPLQRGDPLHALTDPNSIVLTQSTAQRLFVDEEPVGKVLTNGMMVTGLTDDPPANSSIIFDFLIPMANAVQSGEIDPDDWYDHRFDLFVRLHEQASPAAVEDKIRYVYRDADPERADRLYLQPLKRIHLWNISGTGRITYIYVLTTMALLLLAVACINFVNLSTARSMKRSKEIGLRKTVGATRWQLIQQMLVESFIQTGIASVLAVCLLDAVLPMLHGLFGKSLMLQFSGGPLLLLLTITSLTALSSGSYPALVLSSFRPSVALRGDLLEHGARGVNVTGKALVLFQFAVSFVLIFGAVVINGQLALFNAMDLGIERDNIVFIRTDGLDRDYDAIRHELLKHRGVLGVTATFNPPSYSAWSVQDFGFAGKRPDQHLRAGVIWADPSYLDVFGLEIIKGRGFRRNDGVNEAGAHIINETALRAMELEDPIGKMIDISDNPGEIIGVVRDFHFQSLHENIQPLVLAIDQANFRYLCVKITPAEIPDTLDRIKATWSTFRPGQEFAYRFFTDFLKREYEVERRTGSIISWFTVVTVILASLGLFALAANNTQRRTKEVGIRKVLGASVPSIVGLLTRQFLVLVAIAVALATPLAYLGASRWLQSFAYRIELTWSLFFGAACVSVAIALLTVSHQVIRTARANPIEALRYE